MAGARSGFSATKRTRAETENDTVSGPSPVLLTAEQVRQQTDDIRSHRDKLFECLGNSKSDAKDRLREALNYICNAYLQLSTAYMYKLGLEDAYEKVMSSINTACTSAVESCASNNTTYANIAARAAIKRSIYPDKIALDRGKPIPISAGTRIIIGPSEDAKEEFTSASDTKERFLKSVDPVKLRLKTRRINFAANNSIVLETDSGDVDTLRNCPDLSNAGLEIKPEVKLNPRIIVHGIPVEYTKEEIAESIIELNLPDFKQEDIKVISMYPQREKKHRSCIVEVTPECRKALEKSQSIYIKWLSCRFADHISVLQCFKCLKFGHRATDCKNTAKCSTCAGDHKFEDCDSRETTCCVNCQVAKMQNVNHSAFGKSKCPLLRRKIERKAGRINYVVPWLTL